MAVQSRKSCLILTSSLKLASPANCPRIPTGRWLFPLVWQDFVGYGGESCRLKEANSFLIAPTAMNDEPNDPGKKSDKHVETFEDLPEKQKDLHRLKEDAQRSTGKELQEVDEKIEEKAP